MRALFKSDSLLSTAPRFVRSVKLAILGAVVLTICTAAALLLFNREPRHQERSLSSWIDDLDSQKPREVQRPAAEAIRAIGPAALPFLEQAVSGRRSQQTQ